MEDVLFDLANEINNVEITQCWSSTEPDIPLDEAVEDDEDLPLVHCGPFELVTEPRKQRVDLEARQTSAAADSEIKVIVGGSQSTNDDLFPDAHRIVPSFDDVTIDDYHESRFRSSFVIPTNGGAGSAFHYAMFARDDVDSQSSPTFADSERPLPDRPSESVGPPRRLRRRVAAFTTDDGVPEKQEAAEVPRREFGRREDERNVTCDGCDDDDDVDDVTTEVSRRQFHGGGRFVRYRYPTKFHRSASATDLISTTEHQRQQASKHSTGTPPKTPARPSSSSLAEFLPASLRTTLRYGKEPQLQSSPSGHRSGTRTTTDDSVAKKSRRRRKEDTRRDAEAQCSPEPPPSPPPPPPAVLDASTQTEQKKTVDHETETEVKQLCEIAVQAKVETRNRMVETSATIVEFPEIDYSAAKSVTRFA